MKLVIFGSSGGTGQELVKQALAQGHGVTAFVRDSTKLDVPRHEHLQIAVGDVRDRNAVQNAVAGQDAVLVALGAHTRRSTVRYEGTRNILDAMQDTGVRRLICVSSMGVGDSWPQLPFGMRVLVKIFLKHAFLDHDKQEQAIRASDLEWLIVRPGGLTNGAHTGQYHAGDPRGKKRRLQISRADVADFMLHQLTANTYLHKMPSLTY
mgnify:CR=1 FL=1